MPEPPSLKALALRHLARREHSRAELQRKLQPVAQARRAAAAAAAAALASATAPGGDGGEAAASPCDPGPADAGIGQLLDELAARGLQDDARVAETVLAGRGQRLGGRAIAHLLRRKGLDEGLVADAVAQARGGEFERALALYRRRFHAPPADRAEYARQARFLAGRGFAADVIRRVIGGADDNTAVADDDLTTP